MVQGCRGRCRGTEQRAIMVPGTVQGCTRRGRDPGDGGRAGDGAGVHGKGAGGARAR